MIDTILPGVAGIDIGADKLFVAVADAPVHAFATFTPELVRLSTFLRDAQVERVGMEATGVYWIPLHDHLQREGFAVTLFHGAHARSLPGRKSDVADCQWHAMLHSHGLLSPCFVPPEEIRQLRSFYRGREDHLAMGTQHLQHMERALELMNVRLGRVICQLHGVSGMRVVEAILAGERNPLVLAELCATRILNTKRAEVLASLEGTWEDHHLFALRQGLEGYRFYQGQMAACDAQIAKGLKRMVASLPPPPPPAGKVKPVRHNAPAIPNLHGLLHQLCAGKDANLLPGLTSLSWLKLVGEVGTDLTRWPSAKEFTAWVGLAPSNHQSGKRRRRVPRRKTKAGQIFREAAMSIAKSKHLALGQMYRRLCGRRGPAVAMVAVARKVATLYYYAMTRGMEYVEEGLASYEAKCREQAERAVRKMAARLGLSVQPLEAAPV